ncbi:MAG: hypothetical protein HYS22_00030 [Deltaproteobacteria bacterium]|nr:hypothetical protein [Deltaproteobacteria bacterium]
MKKMNKKEKERIKKILMVLLAASSLAACGGGGEENEQVSSGSVSGKAVKGVTSALFSATSSQGSQSTSAFQALQTATTTVDETASETIPCQKGSAKATGSLKGQAGADSVDLSLDESITFDGCAMADSASTSDVDESGFFLTGTVGQQGTIKGPSNNVAIVITETASLKISGTCEGELTYDFKVDASATACSIEGNIDGTLCGEKVSCSLSGSCFDLSMKGSNCGSEDDSEKSNSVSDADGSAGRDKITFNTGNNNSNFNNTINSNNNTNINSNNTVIDNSTTNSNNNNSVTIINGNNNNGDTVINGDVIVAK